MLRCNVDLSVYFIIDPDCCAQRELVDVLISALKGGVTLVQYRDKTNSKDIVFKNALKLKDILSEWNDENHNKFVPFLINDYVDIAKQIEVDGAHIGQGDINPHEARSILGEDKILGLTAFTEDHIGAVDAQVVDYIGTGPVYLTKTDKSKPVLGVKRFSDLVKLSPIPVVGIGGITPDNAKHVTDAGASGVAMMRSISEASDPQKAAEKFRF